MAARASSRLLALFLLLCFSSMPSIYVRFAVISLSLSSSRPSAILVFPGAASSIGDSGTGRVSSSYAMEKPHHCGRYDEPHHCFLLPNYSYQSTPSCSAPTAPHVYGQSLGLLPFPDSTTSCNGDRRFIAVVQSNACFIPETGARGIDVNSREYTGRTTSPSAVSLRRPVVSYLATDADALSLDFSSFSLHNLSSWNLMPLSATVDFNENFSLLYEPKTRRLLPRGTYGRKAARKQHVAIRGKVTPSWLEQAAVAGSVLVGFICTVAGLVLCCIRTKKRPLQSTAATEPEYEDDDEQEEQVIREPHLRRGLGPRRIRFSELAAATDNFAEERKIGRGGFSPVYRGCLISEEDRHVAIKVLSQELSVQGLKEFQAEVTTLSQLRHRNIVRLVGWCGRRGGLAVVYELMPGGSLDTHLYNPHRHLTWPQRYKIALQLGSALRYLHTECDQCVVHGDIKPANVMLDASGNAKLGDFGLARLVDHGAEPQTTQVVAGTVGYIDPEFVSSHRPSAESDVYSFGVVLLEIACGRRPTPSRSSRRPDQAASAALLASVRDMHRRNMILEAADGRLDGEFDRVQMERLLVTGLWCAHHDPVQRPSIAQAVDVLRSKDAELPVVQTMGGSDEEIRVLEGQAYGDQSAQSSVYLDAWTETEYLTTED